MLVGAKTKLELASYEEATDLLLDVEQEIDLGVVTVFLTTVNGKKTVVVLNGVDGDSSAVITLGE